MRAIRMGAAFLLALLFVRLVYMIATPKGGIDGFIEATIWAVAPFVAALVLLLALFDHPPARVVRSSLWLIGFGVVCFVLGYVGLEQPFGSTVPLALSVWQVAGVGAMIAGFWSICGGMALLLIALLFCCFGARRDAEGGV